MLIVGSTLIVLVLLMPSGVTGALGKLFSRLRRRRPAPGV